MSEHFAEKKLHMFTSQMYFKCMLNENVIVRNFREYSVSSCIIQCCESIVIV